LLMNWTGWLQEHRLMQFEQAYDGWT
jgi:hypothetical protein